VVVEKIILFEVSSQNDVPTVPVHMYTIHMCVHNYEYECMYMSCTGYVMYSTCIMYSTQLWTEASFYFYYLPVYTQVRCGELRVRCSRLWFSSFMAFLVSTASLWFDSLLTKVYIYLLLLFFQSIAMR
jgi:hypothetical protein